MKLLVLTTTFPKSEKDYSTPRFVYDLALNIAKQNIETIVITPDRPNAKQKMEKINERFTILRYQYFLKKKQNLTSGDGILPSIRKRKADSILLLLLVFRQFFFTINYIRKHNIKLVNSHWLIPSGLLGAFCQKFFCCKNYVTVHAAGLYLLQKLPFGQKIAQFIFKNSEKIFVVSNFGKNELLKLLHPVDELFHSKIKVIPMGVYTQLLRTKGSSLILEEDTFNILFIGRIVEKKGLRYAIKAFKSLQELDIKLHICGDGPMKKDLILLAQQLALCNNKVVFHGKISERKKIRLLNSCDLLLVPSIETEKGDKEGLPVVVLEALAAKLPIIASNVGGISEIVKHEKNGWLFEPQSPKAIIDAIRYFYENPKMLARIKHKMDSYSKNYDWKVIAKRYLQEMFEDQAK